MRTLAIGAAWMAAVGMAQAPRAIPRPPVQNPQTPAAELGSAAPDGYVMTDGNDGKILRLVPRK